MWYLAPRLDTAEIQTRGGPVRYREEQNITTTQTIYAGRISFPVVTNTWSIWYLSSAVCESENFQRELRSSHRASAAGRCDVITNEVAEVVPFQTARWSVGVNIAEPYRRKIKKTLFTVFQKSFQEEMIQLRPDGTTGQSGVWMEV